jgi:hypothetical protein
MAFVVSISQGPLAIDSVDEELSVVRQFAVSGVCRDLPPTRH